MDFKSNKIFNPDFSFDFRTCSPTFLSPSVGAEEPLARLHAPEDPRIRLATPPDRVDRDLRCPETVAPRPSSPLEGFEVRQSGHREEVSPKLSKVKLMLGRRRTQRRAAPSGCGGLSRAKGSPFGQFGCPLDGLDDGY